MDKTGSLINFQCNSVMQLVVQWEASTMGLFKNFPSSITRHKNFMEISVLIIGFASFGVVSGDCSCGETSASSAFNTFTKIVRGVLAPDHAYPWMGAFVIERDDGTFKQFCAASLINERYLVTAAHCISHAKAISPYRILLGTNKINGSDAIVHEISSFIVHPGFNASSFNNDIALIRLKDPVLFTESVWPICLAQHGDGGFAHRFAVVAGWGSIVKGGKSVNQLRHTAVKVLRNDDCEKNYENTAVNININMLCAKFKGRDSCSGDSGGPLMVNQNGIFTQIGLVSFGIDCGNVAYPGVYTRITRYNKWIRNNSKDGEYCE